MAKFKIQVPAEVHNRLELDAEDVGISMAKEVLPEYHEFVMHLMKEMPTVADEMHHACTGIAGEAGELLDLSKKVWANNKPLNIAHLIEELGDLRFYYQALLNMLDITDDEVVAQNVLKLRKRYADGKYSDAQAHAQADKAPGIERKFFGQPEPIEPIEREVVGSLPASAILEAIAKGGPQSSDAPMDPIVIHLPGFTVTVEKTK